MRSAILLLLALGTVTSTFASVSNCPPNGTTTALSSYSSPNGCDTTNATFSDFTVSSPTVGETIDGNTIAANSIQACATNFTCPPDSSQVYLTSSTVDPGTIELSAPGPFTMGSDPGNGDCGTGKNLGDGGFCLSNSTKGSQYESVQINYTATFNDPITTLGMYVDAVSHSSSTGGAGGAALVVEEICPGVTTFTEGCTGEQMLQAGTVNGNFNNINIDVTASFSPQTTFAIEQVVILSSAQSNGDFSSIVDFGMIDAPEPASLALSAIGLLLLTFTGLRRRFNRDRAL